MSTMKTVAWIAFLLAPALAVTQSVAENAPYPGIATDDEATATTPAIAEDESQEVRLDRLFGALGNAEGDAADRIADEITSIWARSGSASMDLLLLRARKATNDEQYDKARAHLSALTRLAPDFAEAWNASATLYYIQEDYWRSAEHIERVLGLEPRHFGALAGLALVLERVDRDAAALRTWGEVKALFPGMEQAQEAIDRLKPDVDGKET